MVIYLEGNEYNIINERIRIRTHIYIRTYRKCVVINSLFKKKYA